MKLWVLDFGFGLQIFFWPFLFFLRSLMPKKSSGMQKIIYLSFFSPQRISKVNRAFQITVDLQLCQKKPFGTWKFGKIGNLVNLIIQNLKSKHLVCLNNRSGDPITRGAKSKGAIMITCLRWCSQGKLLFRGDNFQWRQGFREDNFLETMKILYF